MPGIINPYLFAQPFSDFITYTGTGASLTLNFKFQPDIIFFINGDGTSRAPLCYDSSRGITKYLRFDPSLSGDEETIATIITATSGNSVTIGTNAEVNTNTKVYYAFAWKKRPKFLDIQTWSGNSTGNRAIAHSLTEIPAVVAVMNRKYLASNANFPVWNGSSIRDNWPSWKDSQSFQSYPSGGGNVDVFGSSNHDISNIYVQASPQTNETGSTYVSYIFNETSNNFFQNSYSGSDASDVTVTHSTFRSPRFYMIKCSSTNGSWIVISPTLGTNKYLLFSGAGTVQTVASGAFTFNETSLVIKGSPSETNYTSSGRIFRIYMFK